VNNSPLLRRAVAGLIAQKAGAMVTEIDGGRRNVFSESILAANQVLHKKNNQANK